MSKIIITESQLQKLFETGSNSAAMDLDHYTREMEFSDGSENRGVEESANEVLEKLKELVYMFKTGKKIKTSQKSKIYKALDDINSVHSEIKSKP